MRTGSGIVDARHSATSRSSSGASSTQITTRPDHISWMTTSALLWLCTLPLIGVLVLPWFGARVAVVAAVVLLVASVTACYAICAWQVAGPKRGAADE